MRKVFLSVAMCAMVMAASAQIKSVDVKANMRSDFGLGIGITTALNEKIDFAPSFNYYFSEGANPFTIDADFHYNFGLADSFTVYPMAGAVLFHVTDFTKFGLNVGAGARYDVNEKIGVFAEAKYQFLIDANGADDTFFTLGVNYSF